MLPVEPKEEGKMPTDTVTREDAVVALCGLRNALMKAGLDHEAAAVDDAVRTIYRMKVEVPSATVTRLSAVLAKAREACDD
jgi:hypothetical protein